MKEEEFWRAIAEATDPHENYLASLSKLNTLAPGYSLLYAFNYVDAGISNAGVSGFYSSSAWPLILSAISACERAKAADVALVLREMILYYDRKGRSKLKRQMQSDYLSALENSPPRSIMDIENAYYTLAPKRQAVWSSLLDDDELWLPA